MTADSTNSHYWLNWRAGVCAFWIVSSVIGALVLIWKYEGSNGSRQGRGETQQERVGFLCNDESWKPCLKKIHPGWLLAFRIVAFFMLLPVLILYIYVDGVAIFYFYSQWTFALATLYFGAKFCSEKLSRQAYMFMVFLVERWNYFLRYFMVLACKIITLIQLGTSLSIYGCYQLRNRVAGDGVEHMRPDAEGGTYVGAAHGGDANRHRVMENSATREECCTRQIAGIWGYAFQIIYQACAGAVVLTDVVFWLFIFPFLEFQNDKLDFLVISVHSMNAFFLLGDAALNCLRFPWFHISYFVLWTTIYVIFQWVYHACVSLAGWPYLLDLSSPYAPIWYLAWGLSEVPSYAVFALLIKMKLYFLSRWFHQS